MSVAPYPCARKEAHQKLHEQGLDAPQIPLPFDTARSRFRACPNHCFFFAKSAEDFRICAGNGRSGAWWNVYHCLFRPRVDHKGDDPAARKAGEPGYHANIDTKYSVVAVTMANTPVKSQSSQVIGPTEPTARKPNRTSFTGDNEWFTPQEHIERVRQVLGAIDLDPASDIPAQHNIKAAIFQPRDAVTGAGK